MNNLIKPILLAFTVIFFFPGNCLSQVGMMFNTQKTDQVKIYDLSGKDIGFKIKGNPKFELRNGVMSIAIFSESNTILQINGINELFLKDTVLTDKSFKVVYIKSQADKPFVSNEIRSNSILTIKCRSNKAGGIIIISVKGKIYNGKQYYRYEALLNGKIPEKKFTSTDHKN